MDTTFGPGFTNFEKNPVHKLTKYFQHWPTSIESSEVAIESTEEDSNFRELLTQQMRIGFLAYLEVMTREREVSNYYLEIYIPREALKIVRAYKDECVVCALFNASEPDFFDFALSKFSYDKHDMTHGALVDFAYDIYEIKYHSQLGESVIDWLTSTLQGEDDDDS